MVISAWMHVPSKKFLMRWAGDVWTVCSSSIGCSGQRAYTTHFPKNYALFTKTFTITVNFQ